MTTSTKTYYWDFFGGQAERTASHFLNHLRDFLDRNQLGDCALDLWSAGSGHHAVRCVAPLTAQNPIERSLRPNRSE